MKKIKIIVGIIIAFISCNNEKLNSQIIGTWSNKHISFEFKENGHVNIFMEGIDLKNMGNFGQFSYKLTPNKLGTLLTIKNKNGELFSRDLVKFDKNKLIKVSFKEGKGINHHIDEYGILEKEGSINLNEENKSSEKKVKYIFPNNIKGVILVAFNEPTGIEEEYDNDGNRIFRIPNNRVLKIKSPVDPFKLVERRAVFFYENEGNLIEITPLEIDKAYNSQELYISTKGYNQVERNRLNKAYNTDFKGNVEFFVIDTYENLLKDGIIEAIAKFK